VVVGGSGVSCHAHRHRRAGTSCLHLRPSWVGVMLCCAAKSARSQPRMLLTTAVLNRNQDVFFDTL
jgi:hypothetical protein